MNIRLDNATCLTEAQKIYERERLTLDAWYRKQIIMFGAGPNKVQNEISKLLNDTLEFMAMTYGVDLSVIRSKSRRREYVIMRHAIMYTLVRKYRYSLKPVGRVLGGRDHSTVISACKNVDKWINRDAFFTTEIAMLDKIYMDRPKRAKK